MHPQLALSLFRYLSLRPVDGVRPDLLPPDLVHVVNTPSQYLYLDVLKKEIAGERDCLYLRHGRSSHRGRLQECESHVRTKTGGYLVYFAARASARRILNEHRYMFACNERSRARVAIDSLPDGTECRVRTIEQPGIRSVVVDRIQAKSTQRTLQLIAFVMSCGIFASPLAFLARAILVLSARALHSIFTAVGSNQGKAGRGSGAILFCAAFCALLGILGQTVIIYHSIEQVGSTGMDVPFSAEMAIAKTFAPAIFGW